MKKRIVESMVESYGCVPDVTYFPGDMLSIRSYFDHRQEEGDATFLIDDDTWDDLDMDNVFKRINLGLSSSGEQYLYYLLRAPTQEREELERRCEPAACIEENPALRKKLLTILAGLGRRSNINIFGLFQVEERSGKDLLLYTALALGLIASVLLVAITRIPEFLIAPFALVGFNGYFHSRRKARDTWKLGTVQYCAAMVAALKKLCAMKEAALGNCLDGAQAALEPLKKLRGPIISASPDGMVEFFSTFFFLDLISFERQKNNLAKHRREFLKIHEILGRLDAAICIASYRESVPVHTAPVVDFDARAPFLLCREAVHPLVARCTPNSLDMRSSLLLTGSNASGKTTFLRTLAVNLVLAQGIGVALAEEFSCSAFRVLSSIDIQDNLGEGDSYYISELKSLHKIVDAVGEPGRPVFCCLDEIFRGTNAVERIAASAEILAYLGSRCLCAAATHDLELCAILSPQFSLHHFEEHIADGEMLFDYRLKPGYSTTSNAIKLLELMGFPAHVVAQAQHRVAGYLKSHDWNE